MTGIAGPGGGTAEKPVGLVYVAAARQDGASRASRNCALAISGAAQVRSKTVAEALILLRRL